MWQYLYKGKTYCSPTYVTHHDGKPVKATKAFEPIGEVKEGEKAEQGDFIPNAEASQDAVRIFNDKYFKHFPIKTSDKAEGFKDGYSNGFYDGMEYQAPKSHNTALDDVVRVLENTVSRNCEYITAQIKQGTAGDHGVYLRKEFNKKLTELITNINQLRK